MDFITGNKFKKISDFIFDENGFVKTKVNNEIPIYFVKTDYVETFFLNYKPKTYYKIITHNSDYPITEKFKNFLEDHNLIKWFGQNIDYKHPKLISIPIGIANERWTHGDESTLTKIVESNYKKENLIYCNFDINTNFKERTKCLDSIKKNGLNMDSRLGFKEYLTKLSKSFFTISPNGNGIDCHKTWESMYLKTIPIVTESHNISFYENYPIYIIKDWETFDIKKISIELYNDLIRKYDDKIIDFDYYFNKLKK
jgi:hypothetical protein